MTDDGMLKFLIGFTVHLYFVLLVGLGFIYMLMPSESSNHDVDAATSISTIRGSNDSVRSGGSQGRYVYVRKPNSRKTSGWTEPVDTDASHSDWENELNPPLNENSVSETNADREDFGSKAAVADKGKLGVKKKITLANYPREQNQLNKSLIQIQGERDRLQKIGDRDHTSEKPLKNQADTQKTEKVTLEKRIKPDKNKTQESAEGKKKDLEEYVETERSIGGDTSENIVAGSGKHSGQKAKFADDINTGSDHSETNISDFSASASEDLSGFVTIAPGWKSGRAKSEKEISQSVKETENNAKRLRKESVRKTSDGKPSSRSGHKFSNNTRIFEEPEKVLDQPKISSRNVITKTGDVRENSKTSSRNVKPRVEYRSVSFSDDLIPSEEHEMKENQRHKPKRNSSKAENKKERENSIGISEYAAVKIRNGQLVAIPSEPD